MALSYSSQKERTQDVIQINELEIFVPIENALPGSPAKVSLSIHLPLEAAAAADDLSLSISYSDLATFVRDAFSGDTSADAFTSLWDLCSHLAEAIMQVVQRPIYDLSVLVKQPAEGCESIVEELHVTVTKGTIKTVHFRKTFIKDLVCSVIIGVNPDERLKPQNVIINVCAEQTEHYEHLLDLASFVPRLQKAVSQTSFLTLEAFTSFVAKQSLLDAPNHISGSPVMRVAVSKPEALRSLGAKSAEVVITRTLEDYPDLRPLQHVAVIAFGSNLGDSACNIETALQLLELPKEVFEAQHPDVLQNMGSVILDVVDTSFLYQTEAMYVTSQPPFLNGACVVVTNLSPSKLLLLVKAIEVIVGRVPSIRFGPRAVDLDIIFYDSEVIDTRADKASLDMEGHLVVPHPLVQEREFVLRPLNDMIPHFVHPVIGKSISDLLKAVVKSDSPTMQKIIPFPSFDESKVPTLPGLHPVPDVSVCWSYSSTSHPRKTFIASSENQTPRTKVMATLNVTPDSFSDGSKHNTVSAATRYVVESVYAGANIIDIGGYSTRPSAQPVPVQEEIDRVVPAVQAIRHLTSSSSSTDIPPKPNGSKFDLGDVEKTLISVDTFRWEVAEAAIRAGANCMNDVYAFSGPDYGPLPLSPRVPRRPSPQEYTRRLKSVARKYATPVILMHSRGDAGQNKDYTMYDYAPDSAVLEGVRVELGNKVDRIVRGKGGVRRWLVIMDPGVGFSKSVEGNLQVISQAQQIVADILVGEDDHKRSNPLKGYPLLIGASKKSFLGTILSQGQLAKTTEPSDRGWATAAAVSAAVQQGSLVIRVHDVKEMMDVIRVSEALWG